VAGPSELGARLVPALAALALSVTFGSASPSCRSDAGIVAALLLATNPAVFALARYAILDTVFTAFCSGGGTGFVAAIQRRPNLQWPGYLLIALAVLSKGPIALVLCGLAFCLTILWSADARRRLFDLRLGLGTVLVILIASPWFVLMWLRFSDAFVAGYLLDENIRLFATDRFSRTASNSVRFYFRVLAAGLLPWTALVVGRLYDDLLARAPRDRSTSSMCCCGADM
jgi:4-amino-4-deoxy-L-arabinose transferase-like glycosyltransferase